MIDKLMALHSGQTPRIASLFGLQLREDVAYTDAKDQSNDGIRRRTGKQIERLHAVLRRLLRPDEALFYVARCDVKPSLFEQFTVGSYLRYYSRISLVLTNQRGLFFFVYRDGVPRGSIRSLTWGDLQEATVTGWINRILVLKFRNGAREQYWRLKRCDAAKVRAILDTFISAPSESRNPAQSTISLCPKCLKPLDARVYHCAGCGQNFKSEVRLLWQGVLVPGGGYFYVGQRFAGLLHFIGEIYLILLLVLVLRLFVTTSFSPAPAGNLTHDAGSYLASTIADRCSLVLGKMGDHLPLSKSHPTVHSNQLRRHSSRTHRLHL